MFNSETLYQMCVSFLLLGAATDNSIERDEWLHRAMVVSGMLEARERLNHVSDE